MSNEQALLHCTFGWGKTCRLYLDSLEIAGKAYNLDDLTSIYPTYRNIFGVPSARLELSFGTEHLVLRGIPDMETARLLVSQLKPYCSDGPHTAHSRSRSAQARTTARAQARAWERTSKLPAIPVSPEGRELSKRASGGRKRPALTRSLSLDEDGTFEGSLDDLPFSEIASEKHEMPLPVDAAFAPDNEVEAYVPAPVPADPWPLAPAQPVHTPRFQPPLRSVHLIPPGQKLQDTSSMPIPAIQSSVLPIIHVPVRLQPGECAHYSIGAALCSDRISGSDRAPYPPLDHGLLILTNRRIFYIGKRSQLILAYTHLWYVSLLHNAIALHIEQQFRRIIVELEHPHEWASRIEQLSFVARRTQPRPELPTLLMAALPGIQSSSLSAATLKRPALKKPAATAQAVPASASGTPLLPDRIESNIVEAQTIALTEQGKPGYADTKTLDFPLLSEVVNKTPADPIQQPDPGDMETQDLAERLIPVEKNTQDLAQQPTLMNMTTQEIFSAAAREAEKAARAQEQSAKAVETSALYDPAAPLAWDDNACEDIDTLPLVRKTDYLDDEDTQTILLRNRRPVRVRYTQDEPVSDQLPDLEITDRRLPRVRGSRIPAYAKKMPPTHRSGASPNHHSEISPIHRPGRLSGRI